VIREIAVASIFPFLHDDLQRLSDMVRSVPNFPKPGIQFQHVLGISQQPGGLALCTTLLRGRFIGAWDKVDAIVCCEVGGFISAPTLASLVGVSLVPIREAGKLPPPTVSVTKDTSYISSVVPDQVKMGKRVEVEQNAITGCDSVVVVDDVLSTGETLCAVLHMLKEVGVESVTVMVVAEFPLHRGRRLLHDRGYGMVNVQSLLVFDGA
jgi:adenine phosphoribosyltransferase